MVCRRSCVEGRGSGNSVWRLLAYTRVWSGCRGERTTLLSRPRPPAAPFLVGWLRQGRGRAGGAALQCDEKRNRRNEGRVLILRQQLAARTGGVVRLPAVRYARRTCCVVPTGTRRSKLLVFLLRGGSQCVDIQPSPVVLFVGSAGGAGTSVETNVLLYSGVLKERS